MRRWFAQCLLICIVFSSLATSVLPGRVAQAEPSELVWKPYLQQMTDRSAVVLWATKSGSIPSVAYGITTLFDATASGSTRTLDMLGYHLHRVELDNLKPNTTYVYSIHTDGAELLPDETLQFTTAPAPNSTTPVTFLAFGDFGKDTASQRNLRDRMLDDSFNFIVTTGDNVYETGTYSQFDTRMFQVYGDLFWRGGLFPSIGNHDTYTDNAAPYLDLFDLPTNAWRAEDNERYYSFDYGSVHVVVLDSNALLDEADSSASDDMFDWLRADLSTTTQPWKVAVFHHPPYSTGTSHGSDSRARAKLVPILEQSGVQLVLNGHDHIYERSKPLRGGQVTTADKGGITYIVTGAGAAATYGCGDAAWVVVKICSSDYGIYNRITADQDSMHIEAVRDTGAVVDDLTLHLAGAARSATPAATGTPTTTPKPTTIPKPTAIPKPTSTPSNGNTIWLPGMVQAEAYRSGGEGPGYYDTTVGNSGGAYRNDDVDIEACNDGTECYNVGWTEAGEWLEYDVQVATSSSYIFQVRVATTYNDTKLHLELDGQPVSGALAIPNTGDWQTWTTVQSAPISLSAGPHTLRLVWDTDNVNVNYMDVVPASTSSAIIEIPGRIEAEAYRAGGEGIGYHDTTAGNKNGAYRADDVDIEPCRNGMSCYNVGWADADEWLGYDVIVAKDGRYTVAVRVATQESGRRIRVEVDDVDITGWINVPNTDDWQAWKTVTSAPIMLAEGQHTLRLAWERGDVNVDYVDIVPVATDTAATVKKK